MSESASHYSPTPPFQDHLKQSLQALRGALTELFARAGVDPSRPPELAQRLGLSRTLAWRASKVAQARDVTGCVQYVPRRAGMQTLLRALEKHGAGEDALERGRQSFEAFEEMVRTHGGDRETLELLAETLLPGNPRADLLEQNRKLAFQGNSGTLGVQAGCRMSTYALVPSREKEGFVDLVQLVGMLQFRRLRPDVRWTFFRISGWSSSNRMSGQGRTEPLAEESPEAPGVPLVPEFSSSPLPALEQVVEDEAGDVVNYELPEGPIGNSAAIDCFYGTLQNQAGYAWSEVEEGEEDICELGTRLITPVERVQMDVLVHEDLGWGTPRPSMQSLLGVEGHPTARLRGRTPLPFAETVHELGVGLDTMSTPHYPRYRELLDWALSTAGFEHGRLRGYRLSVAFPPIPSVAVLTFDLPRSR
jgi:hypothetical protein